MADDLEVKFDAPMVCPNCALVDVQPVTVFVDRQKLASALAFILSEPANAQRAGDEPV